MAPECVYDHLQRPLRRFRNFSKAMFLDFSKARVCLSEASFERFYEKSKTCFVKNRNRRTGFGSDHIHIQAVYVMIIIIPCLKCIVLKKICFVHISDLISIVQNIIFIQTLKYIFALNAIIMIFFKNKSLQFINL